MQRKGWEDLGGKEERVDLGLKDTGASLKVQVKCGKTPKGSENSIAHLT